jgi:glutaredoxin-like YruB-family protein
MNKKVKVYGLPTCPVCRRTKKYLEDEGIDYEYLDVSANRDLAKEMIAKSGQKTVPVVEIGGEIIIGFDKAKIEELLKG